MFYNIYSGVSSIIYQDPRAVLVGLLLVLSAFQYFNQWTTYTQVILLELYIQEILLMLESHAWLIVYKNKIWNLDY